MLINGRYRVVGTLGSGSHSSVFHVLDLRHDERPIALKLLRHDRPSELLRWEFSQLRRLEHPNISSVYELDTIDRIEGERPDSMTKGSLFLTQDLVTGQSADVAVLPLKGDPAELGRWVVAVAAAVCRALVYLHERGIVHRDVKPANVIVGEDPLAARLIDLSLSTGGVLGPSRGTAGSLAFMAPEAMGGAAEPRSDLFSLGVTMDTLLSGSLPFGSFGADTATTVRAILDGHPRSLADAAPHVSEELTDVVASLLLPRAQDRPPSARTVLIELGRRFGPKAVGLDEGLTGAVDAESEVIADEHDWAALARTGVLFGRDRELGLLSTLLDERLDPLGRGSPVLAVVGPAGVGKSALLREVTQHLQLRAAASGAPAPALLRGTIRHVASTLREEVGRDTEFARLSAWLGERAEDMDRTEEVVEENAPDTIALCEELTSLVVMATASRQVVLHLEDESDGIAEDFAAFLHRSGDVDALTTERRPPLSVVLECRVEAGQQLPVPEGVAVVELRPLADDDMRKIVVDRLGQAVSEPLLAAAVSASRGRPLLLFAFLSRAASLGPLRLLDETALSTLRGERGSLDDLESDVANVLEGLVRALPEPQRSSLLALALWGRPGGSKELAHLLEVSSAEAIERLGELWRRGSVELGADGRIRPISPDLAAQATGIQGHPWVQGIHHRALALLDETAPSEIAARARHARAADHPLAEALSVEAGAELLAAGDPVAAIAHVEAVLESDVSEVRERATDILRRALLAAGRYDRAVELWTTAVERSESGARRELARALRLSGRPDAAQRCAIEELEALETDARSENDRPGWGTRALLARLELDRGEARAALEFVGGCKPGDARGDGAAAFEEAAGLAHLALGDIDDASAHFHACMTLARDGGVVGRDRDETIVGSGRVDKNLASRAHNLLGMVAHHKERWSEAGGHYAESESLARAVGHAHAAATSGVNVAVARLEAGELGEALSPLRRSIATLAGIGSIGELAGALYNYGSLLMALGDIESGLRVHERALAAARKTGARHIEAYCGLLLGDLYRRRAGLESASAALDAYALAVKQFEVLEAPREQCLGRLLASEMLAASGRMTEAVSELERASTLLPADRGPALSARLAVTRARLALAGAGSLDEASRELNNAMVAIRGLEQLDLRWRGELLLARLLARRGEQKGAVEALDEAERILAQLSEHVPDQYRPLWSSDPEREPLESLKRSLGEDRPLNSQLSKEPPKEDPLPLRRLLAINKRLNSELRLGRLLDEIIDTIIELTEAERGFLLIKGKDDILRPRSARNVDRHSLASDDMRVSRSIAEQVVESGEAVVTVDAQSDGRFETASSVHALRLRSILAVPLRVKGTVVGAVYVDDRVRPGAFGDGALQLALSVADQAAIAIDNARLHNENRRRQRKIEALNRKLQRELDRQKVELEELRRELDGQRREMATKYTYDAIVAQSAAMNKLFRILDRVTDSEVPVVIQGESGTGKELCARAIHFNGPRRERPFVTENCGAIPETLLESILFGHVKGAFTGADRTRPGLFEVASGGTLLLDEISEMSPAMQSKLLRVLQEGELRPVGGSQTVQVDVRIITSSNRDLGELVRRSAFREDLYYRLNVITVRLPSLRERPEDVPLLVEHFIKKHGGGRVVGVDRTALRRLAAYSWPGNVRQLENEIMRSVVLADDIIREEHLTPEIADNETSGKPDDLDIKGHVAQLETRLIRAALERFKGNQSRAANALGLSRYGLQKKMARFGLTARP